MIDQFLNRARELKDRRGLICGVKTARIFYAGSLLVARLDDSFRLMNTIAKVWIG
jgi:hypothetical protein